MYELDSIQFYVQIDTYNGWLDLCAHYPQARKVFQLSQHERNNFPFATVSINVTGARRRAPHRPIRLVLLAKAVK